MVEIIKEMIKIDNLIKTSGLYLASVRRSKDINQNYEYEYTIASQIHNIYKWKKVMLEMDIKSKNEKINE